MRLLILLSLAIIVVDGCVDPLEVAIPEVKFQLVVDGYITNEPGPYTVKLYRARPLETDLDRLIAEKFAKITLKDDAGNSELLTEVAEGVYQTAANGIQGTTGRSYHLEILTITGRKFFSDPEEILPVGQIENVSYEFDSRESGDGFRIFVNAKGVESLDDLIRFRVVGTYEVETFPKLRTKRTDAGIIPDPYPCSGYGLNQNGGLAKLTECTCCTCWVNQYDDIPVVADEQFSSNQFVGLEVGFVPVNRQTFYSKYRVEVQQMSLTNTTHLFWKLVRAQKTGITDLFQPPASRIQGNIHSSDPADNPLGIFWAAGIDKKSVFIEKTNLPYLIQPIDTLVAPCQYFPYSTNQKPIFWK
jgi:Domain of unknown function (DUF4249)